MNLIEQKKAAKSFVERWQNMPCVEEEHSRSFWIELLQDVLGIPNVTRLLEFERKVKGRKIDVFYEDMGVLIEMKGRGISLDKAQERSKKAGEETPYKQAKWYADNLPLSVRPRWIITCNFDEFRIYDQEKENQEEYVSFLLEELTDQVHMLAFFTNKDNSRIEREKKLSVDAGELVGKLYTQLTEQYKNIETSAAEQRSLNVLIVRLVFLLYAEDAGILQKKNAFYDYLRRFDADMLRQAIIDLFSVLDTPEDERDQYLPSYLAEFPYINGGLFGADDIIVPQFNAQIRLDLLQEVSYKFDWSDISPTIFGAVFESTLNPQTRRSGGMHYTSIENIHKVIDPLFLDDLKAELIAIEGEKSEKNRTIKLRAFQAKLASIRVIDTSCGSGNFLTESYLSLRKLENRVIENLQGSQVSIGFAGEESPIKVSISQFYGIEINDFAVSVAKTALWIAEEQMMEATQEIVRQVFDFLPLKSNSNICEGNALRMDWNDVLSAQQCTYIVGNPPFIGYSNHSKEQGADRELLFGKVKTVDYVACWYKKAAIYMQNNKNIHAAFVSTNSICQGQQVEPIWKPLFEDGICINFAHKSFIWDSEATDKAHVHVVIVGFSYEKRKSCILFEGEQRQRVDNINGYLAPARNVFIARRKNPLCNVCGMTAGGKPVEGGFLLLSQEEKDQLLRKEPKAEPLIRPFSMGEEFIKGIPRYCIWMDGANLAVLDTLPLVRERVQNVREYRLVSKKAATRKKAETPWLFDEVRPPKGQKYIALPAVSSSRRKYIPTGFVSNGMIPGNKLFFISNGNLYVFGVLMSLFHNAWMRVVTGRLGMGYNYSNVIVYNNFPWPGVTKETITTPVEECVSAKVRQNIENCAQTVLDVRAAHPAATLADLYDPDKMPLDLLAAHNALDKAVESAYGVDFNANEEQIVAHLFKLYDQLTSP